VIQTADKYWLINPSEHSSS
jgi:hypothetical protein